jgi:hypothetical protein
MKTTSKMITALVGGFVTGVCLLFIALVAAVGFAYVTTQSVHLPGIIHAWFTTENGMPALNFEPNFIGMLVAVLLVATITVLVTWMRLTSMPGGDIAIHD